MATNWNLLFQAPDAGAAFQAGFQGAQQMRQQAQMQNALLQRQGRMDQRQAAEDERQAQAAAQAERAQQLQQTHQQISITARLLDTVTDEPSYQQARQAAQGLGLDVSKVPPNFDPNWVQQTRAQARALAGDLERELLAVAPGTAVIDKRTGQPVFKNPDRPRYHAIAPGGYLAPEPGAGGAGNLPRIGTPEEAQRLPPGSQFIAPDGSVRTVPGGAPASPAPTFP